MSVEDAIRELVRSMVREELERQAPADPPERLLDVRAACERLGGIARSTLYELLDAGELRSLKIGRRRVVPESAIAEYARRAA